MMELPSSLAGIVTAPRPERGLEASQRPSNDVNRGNTSAERFVVVQWQLQLGSCVPGSTGLNDANEPL